MKKGGVDMATTYRKKYCDDVMLHFSQMRKNKKGDIVGVPSFLTFAESLGVTVLHLEKWRRDHGEFDKACDDASEILRQLLIDAALNGAVNVSAAKFILSHEFGMGVSSRKDKEALGDGFSDADRALMQNLLKRLGCDEVG